MKQSRWKVLAGLGVVAGLCVLLLASCSGESPELLIKSARDYIAKGDSSAAVIQLRNALQKAPNNAEARYLLGNILVTRRDPASAVKELRMALQLGHPAEQTLPALARALIDDGDAKELVTEFGEKTLGTAEAQAEFKTIIGNAWLSIGKPKEAEAAFNAALAAKPDYADASLGIATLRAGNRNFEEAKKIVEAVLARPHAPPEASLLQAQLLFADGQPDAARAVLEKLVQAKPEYLQARYRLAALQIARGDLDQASAQVAAIRKVSKQDGRAYYFEALIASGRGDLPAARADRQGADAVLMAFENARALPRRHVPGAHGGIPPRADDELPVGAVGGRGHVGGMAFEHAPRPARGELPQAEGRVPRSREQHGSVG